MNDATNTITTVTGTCMIDLKTGVVTGKMTGLVRGKAIRTASAVIAKCPAGTAAILWMPVGEKTATITLTREAADLWDAARDAELAAERQASLATPEGQRAALVTAIEAAERKHAKSFAGEQTRHADADALALANARNALDTFDAAHFEVVNAIREQQSADDAILAHAGR